ncbi:MAG: hypothetical protein A3C79_00115 [Candidatus Taylorbacteria bacterium RIFCSPHIGHO2_02_FULL_45_28]|uniref:Diaminopimelate decarboxylase n=1 Tax=Candidatus Taylorbacteria bacterium RIFCSPHIGHO2_12_FULL_45_16 TaxID=1802315 RepID=A0A1G2MYT9_9BACT|nr:MAG: hypothetical protein A2830_01375 [Candidatus Taylorbacteria bacterium RIFCSPHIGHO2_01_FULL_44_110]OHA25437.1 MAG: hypothetical protein A3C79_00115 [Candidatus Taylorbacteria bacterium RIFCSPHIGHO2_02_FULL_45_28]OHA29105.1 MAG: hypothetical protein A3F51_00585 [Candidatus Taylorbacteria bacterium RIFCSPHIGHO2_12_FULL_45_16]OHA33327.1 MAG: hypothetical protein A3A23_01465 [Candidatus Taylorbacteria bacterium RIFCSPLOWO2_01_FULL_45_59]OHA44668.1 MAG: hypothetical protein A3G04_00690 [Candi
MPILKSFSDRLHPALPAIIKKFGTPFLIYDEEGIRDSLRRLKRAFSAHLIPFQEFYAVKALPKPDIMDIIHSEGCGFDCSSIPELRLARAAGAKPENIIFTSNNTAPEEFEEALANGGCILNLDDEIFVDEIPGPFPELICFRVHPGNRHPAPDQQNKVDVSSKYGVPFERIIEVFRKAEIKGAKRFGIHGMFFSNDLDYQHLVGSVRLLLELAGQIWRELRISLEFLDFGGGMGIPYRPTDREFDVESFAFECGKLLGKFRHDYGFVPKLYAESGRWVTGTHGVLINRAMNRYRKYSEFIGVQVAMPALMRVAIYSTAYHQCSVLDPNGIPREGQRGKFTVAGSICEGCDVLARDMEMAVAYEGDLIQTDDCGAHAIAMAFNYNGRCRPQELLWKMHSIVRRICRAETYDDLDMRHRGLCSDEHVLHL